MVTRSSKCGREGKAGLRPRLVQGAHASRAVATAYGDGPVGVEALGRFDAMLVLVRSGNVRRKPSATGVDACAPWMSAREGADWRKPAITGVTGLSARFGPRWTAGLTSRELGFSPRNLKAGAGPNQCVVRLSERRNESRECQSLNLKEGVGLGIGAAVPGLAHAILEACGWC